MSRVVHASVALLTTVLAVSVRAEIIVPQGFTAQQIAPLLDEQVPRLSAIDDPEFGTGVISGAVGGGVATFRLIEPAGTISGLGAFSDPLLISICRIRHDQHAWIDGMVHVSTMLSAGSSNTGMVYLTLSPAGVVTERWRQASNVTHDLEFANGQSGLPPGAILLDQQMWDYTQLASMDPDFHVTVVNSNSLPPGRFDTDVRGFQRDATGLYGGGVLLADSDSNHDNVSAIYELRDVDQGGVYRLIGDEVSTSVRFYGDLAVSSGGDFGSVVYIAETITGEIQTVDPNGVHTTWATGFVGIRSVVVSPDGNTMYVSDLNGVWLIRATGNEPGPVVLCHDPSTPSGAALAGNAVNSLRIIFNEPVSFTDSDVTVLNANEDAVDFDASASGSQFMIIGLAEPLENDTYTITVADSVTSLATGQPLDGAGNGVAGGDYVFSLRHRDCCADCDDDGDTDVVDFAEFQLLFSGPLP